MTLCRFGPFLPCIIFRGKHMVGGGGGGGGGAGGGGAGGIVSFF